MWPGRVSLRDADQPATPEAPLALPEDTMPREAVRRQEPPGWQRTKEEKRTDSSRERKGWGVGQDGLSRSTGATAQRRGGG